MPKSPTLIFLEQRLEENRKRIEHSESLVKFHESGIERENKTISELKFEIDEFIQSIKVLRGY